MKKRGHVTLTDIAREVGVSAMTVSRALSGHPDVNEEKRKRIVDLAGKLKYRPNRWARALITDKSYLVGIVIPDISQPFFCEIYRGIEEILGPQGYDMVLCHSDRSPANELREIDMLLSRRIDGLIVASVQSPDTLQIFEEMQEQGTPFVLIDRFFEELDCPRVRADDRLAGRLATQHLIDLGHRRIAHIIGPVASTGRLRLESFRETMQVAGLEVDDELLVMSDFKNEGGYEAMKRLMRLAEPPTAVFAGNHPMALGAARACIEAGLRLPQDISIAGAGDAELPGHPEPFLTTVVWDRGELGRRAAGMLLDYFGENPPESAPRHVMEPRLVVARSTGPVPGGAS